MFKIYDGREHFYQWDLDRKLIVGDRSIAAVHFCNRTSDCALARDCYELEGNWVVDVPNICLQEDYRLKVYGYSEAKYTVLSDCFDIVARTKPEEYAYTEDEINCWQELDERLTRFEENIEEAIAEEVEAYLAANPIEKGATDAEKEQIARNTEDIAALKSKADTYATEEYVNEAVANAGGSGVGMDGGGEGSVILNDYDNNDASGRHSLAEGSATAAEGKSSHAEGGGTTASGNFSHAEGRGTNAFGAISHAEGYLTQASGEASHAEGAGTTASGNYQHAQGRSNIEDTENRYALIVGNGDEPDNSGDYGRSNAHTLDWEGNAWFAGNVRVGGTCWDDATELGAGGGSAIEIVNASGDFEEIELDKTYDEIMAMIEAGKVVVIKYNDYLFYQYSDSPAFRYVGEAETRYIGFNKRDGSVRYSEAILPTYEDVGTIVEEAIANAKYIVKATSNKDNGKIELDKEIDEIKDAYNSGKEIVLTDGIRTYELSKHLNYTLTFIWMNQEVWDEINVDYDNNVITNRFGYFINDAAIENKLSGYATERYVNKAISGFATETYVSNALKPYAKTTDIPNVSAYQTAEQVEAIVANYVGVIENGTY